MSASVTTTPARRASAGSPRPSPPMALVVVLAVTIALVAMNGTKAAAPATLAPKARRPAVIDRSYSSGEKMVNPIWAPSLIPTSPGGFGGPRLTAPSGNGNNGPHLRAQ